MFGLSTREMLKKMISNASLNNIESYKQDIREVFFTHGDDLSKEQQEEYTLRILREYQDNVANDVINSFKNSNTGVFEKMFMMLTNPELCGYEDIDIDIAFPAGALYAICFCALKGKKADPKDCIFMNHVQHEIIDRAWAELEEEYAEKKRSQ